MNCRNTGDGDKYSAWYSREKYGWEVAEKLLPAPPEVKP